MNFEDFFKSLTSDEIWHEFAGKNHKPETFRKVAEQVFTLGLSDRDAFGITPIREHRNHVVNKLGKIKPDKVSTPWHVQAAINIANAVKDDDWKAVSPEERAKRLKEWEDMVKGSTILNSMPKPSYKQLAEEGGVLPPKPAPYPITSPEEAYIKDRHLAYIEYAYEPRSGEKMPGVMSEELFNVEYDQLILNKSGK